MVHDERFSSTPAAVKKSFTATLFERKTMLKTLKRKIALVAVAGLGFGLISTVPAFAVMTAATDLTVAVKSGAADTTLRVVPRTTTTGARTYDIFTTGNTVALSDLTFTATGTWDAAFATETVPLSFKKEAVANGALATGYNTLSMARVSGTGTGTAGSTISGIGAATTNVAGTGTTNLGAAAATLASTAAGSDAGGTYGVWVDYETVGTVIAGEPRITLNIYDMTTAAEADGRWSQTATTVRTDDTAYEATIGAGVVTAIRTRITAAGANDLTGAQVSVTWRATPTASAVTISTVNPTALTGAGGTSSAALGTGVRLTYTNNGTGERELGNPASGVYTIAGGAVNDAPETIDLLLGRNAVPGIYTLTVNTGTSDTGATPVQSKSLTIGEAPATIALKGATSTTADESATGAGNTTFYFTTADSSGRASYFLGTEKANLAVSGGSVAGRVTISDPVIPTIGSGSMTATAASQRVSVTATAAAGAAGTYTITTTASGFATTAVTPAAATSTLTVTSDALVSAAATKFTNATPNVSGSNTAVDATVSDSAAATDNTSPVATFLPVDQTKITLTGSFPTTTVGDAKVTVTSSTIPGVTAGTIVIKPISAGTATFEFNATGTAAGQTARFSLQGTSATNLFQIDVTYGAAVAGEMTLSPIEDGNSALVAVGSTNTLKASVTDQFGRVLPGATVVFTVQASQRATARSYSYTTNASGEASLTLADTSTSTTVLTNAINVSASAGGNTLATQTITYVYGDATPATVTLAVTQNSGAQGDYLTTITSATAPATTVDTSLGSTNNTTADLRTADQVKVVATITAANSTAIRGQLVKISGDAGVFFTSGGTVGDVDLAAATRKSTLEIYTDANGQVTFQAAYTKSGAAVNVKVEAGSVSKSWPIKVNAGPGAVLALTGSGSNVTAKLTDAWGNPVAANVTMTVSGGLRFSNGFSSTTGTTAADGTLSTEIQGSGSGTVTATHGGADAAILASATYGTAAGVESATQAVTGAAATVNAATETAIGAVKTDVKAVSDTVATLSKAVTTVQSSVTELTSSFATQIKSLTDAIAKISRAIAAIQKSLKKK